MMPLALGGLHLNGEQLRDDLFRVEVESHLRHEGLPGPRSILSINLTQLHLARLTSTGSVTGLWRIVPTRRATLVKIGADFPR